MTNVYNVLEKLRSGEPLTPKEKITNEQGLVSILRELHDELDRTVFEAYGWSDLAEQLVGRTGATKPLSDKPKEQAEAEEELLSRLVKLNEERAAEEANGLVRWLRPEYQNPQGARGEQSKSLDLPKVVESSKDKEPWPKAMQDQFKAVSAALGRQNAPASAEQIAREFKRAKTNKVEELLSTLVALGTASMTGDQRYQAGGV